MATVSPTWKFEFTCEELICLCVIELCEMKEGEVEIQCHAQFLTSSRKREW